MRLRSVWPVLAALLVACGDDGATTGAGAGGAGGAGGTGGGSGGGPPATLPPPDLGDWTGEEPPVLEPAEAPAGALSGVAATRYAAISCGPHDQNVFDLLVPDDATDAPPLVVFVHGGGFVSGEREVAYDPPFVAQTASYLDAGFAYATLDYRSLFADGAGVRSSLQDIQVCVQFIRHHAETLGIDPERIVLTGESAGAGAALWLGTHDDLADPDGGHAILATSTRVRGILPIRPQSTYDVLRWPEEVFAPEYEELVADAIASGQYDIQLITFYGAPDAEAVSTDPELIAYRGAVDMLAHLSGDDPPIFASGGDPDEPPIAQEVLFHHPFHIRAIADVGEAAGVDVTADAPALGLTSAETPTELALRLVAP